MNIQQIAKVNYKRWEDNVKDIELLSQLTTMNEEQITNAFYRNLEFGTAGLRGEISVGTNCLNIYTIAKTTMGIVRYMQANNMTSVAISYDSRNKSMLFAHIVASVFASNNIKAHIVRQLMPTPFLSYCVTYFKCDIGVMITASHNPSEYNGYKVYGSEGYQCTDDAANCIASYIDNVDEFAVEYKDFESLLLGGLIQYISVDVENSYKQAVKKQLLNKCGDVSVMYTPLNGAGVSVVPQLFSEIGVKYKLVDEQSYPDGNFTTCKYPNPEKLEALKLGLQYAACAKSDILIATDPDCDRVGIAVRHNGEYVCLTGNEVGALLIEYILSQKKLNGTLSSNAIIIKTIVTSDLGAVIAKDYNAKCIEVLTGFKYIGEIVAQLVKQGRADDFIMGFEESYGYLIGAHARDKDAAVTVCMIAEMTAYYLSLGMTLVDQINKLYARYGYFQHVTQSYVYKGAKGDGIMKGILADIRSNLPSDINGLQITEVIDYETQQKYSVPKANVLQFNLQDGSKLIIRPSGTEPLIKVYLTVCQDRQTNDKLLKQMNEYLSKIFSK